MRLAGAERVCRVERDGIGEVDGEGAHTIVSEVSPCADRGVPDVQGHPDVPRRHRSAAVDVRGNIRCVRENRVAGVYRAGAAHASARGFKNEIISKLKARGYGWVDWSAGDGDGGGLASNEQAFANFKSTINDNIEVILFHDYSKYTTAILPDAINYLKENGYEIYPLFYESNKINK